MFNKEVEDKSGGCGQSFDVKIVSKDFEGKTPLQRHRIVNDALKEEIAQVHAFTLVSSTIIYSTHPNKKKK